MRANSWFDGRPSIFVSFLTDDFGDEIQVVGEIHKEIDTFQIAMSHGTWMHIFNLDWKVMEWRNGHREE